MPRERYPNVIQNIVYVILSNVFRWIRRFAVLIATMSNVVAHKGFLLPRNHRRVREIAESGRASVFVTPKM